MAMLQDNTDNGVAARVAGSCPVNSMTACEACTVPGQLYRQIVETMQEGLWVLDHAGVTTFVNRPMAAMLGYEPNEMIGRPLFEFMDDAGRVAANHYFERRMRGISEEHEFRFLNKAGESVWTSLSTRSLMNDAGEFQGTLATIQDLTEQRRIKKQMLEDQTSLRMFLNELPATAWSIDRNYIIQRSYGAGLKTFGLVDNQLAGQSLIEFMAGFEPNIRDGLIESHDKALAGQSVQVEHWFGDRLIHNRIEPIQAPSGDVVGAIGISLDLTEQRLAERELARSEGRLRTILQTAPDAILTTDDQGTVLSANSAAEQLFGLNQPTLIGMRLEELIRGGPWSPAVDKPDGRLLTSRLKPADLLNHHGMNLMVRGPQGRLIPVEITAGQVDHLPIYTLIVRDVSRVRELQLQLVTIAEDQQRRIGQELHDDLGQELTGAAMLAEALAIDLQNLGETKDNDLLPLAERLSRRLVRGRAVLRGLAKGLALAVIDTNELLMQLDELAASVRTLHGLECHWRAPEGPIHLDAEMATQLFRLAQEAVTNALKHSGASRIEIALTTTVEGSERTAELKVADNGCGLKRPSEAGTERGMGLRIMRYRAGLIGAVLEIQEKPDGGTVLLCKFKERHGDE